MIKGCHVKHKINRTQLNNKVFFTLFLTIILTAVGSITILLQASSAMGIVNRWGILLLFIICIYKGRKESYIFNPYYLFSITPLSLLLYFESASPYYLTELNQSTWNVAIFNIAMFIIGLSLIKSSKPTKYSIKKNDYNKVFDIKKMMFHTWFLLLLGMLPTIYAIIIGFPILISGNLYEMETYATAMPLASVFTLFKYPAIACAIKSKKKKTIVITIIFCILAIFINFNKFEIALFLVTVLISISKYSIRTQRENVRLFLSLILGSLILLWSFGYYDSLRGYDTANYLIEANRVSDTLSERIILPYLYLTTPWTNLQFVMETSTMHTYGLWVLKPFINYLQLDVLFIEQYRLIASSSFNTFTYITVLFKDFGFIGSGIISLLMGLVIKKIYVHFRSSTSPLAVATYALNAFAVLMMFFSNHFFMVSYPITILILMGLYKVSVFRIK